MVQIFKKDYTQFSRWNCEDRNYTDYFVVVNGVKSYFHRIDKCAKKYEILSRHEMAVRLMFFRKTGYKYVDCNIPSSYQPGCTIAERFDFIRKNGYTPDPHIGVNLYWAEETNCWVFIGNLRECSYAWHFYIYDRKIVDYILQQIRTLPEEWNNIKIEL